MSLKNLRARFHGHKPEQDKKSPEEEEFVDVLEPEDSRFDAMTDFCQGLSDTLSVSSFRDEEERAVFEQQLNNLQEQLVSVMIENQSLAQKLKRYQEEKPVDELKHELLKQTQRCKSLEEKLYKQKKKKKKKRKDSYTDSDDDGAVEEARNLDQQEADKCDSVPLPSIQPLPPEGRVQGVKTRIERLFDRLVEGLYDIFEDFTEEPAPVANTEEDPLTVKTLKGNIKRFQTAVKPFIDTFKGLYNLITWKSPAYTFIIFIVYLYSVYNGVLVPLLLFLFAFKLFISYLQHRNILTKNIVFLDPGEDQEAEDKDLGLSDKFNLVLHVARKAQNTLGTLADNLEKLRNLFTWRYPPATKRVFIMLCSGFVCTCVFSASTLLTVLALVFGVKIFCITHLYNKYPRLKRKHDSTHRLWQALPTDAEYEQRVVRDEMNKYVVVACTGDNTESLAATGHDSEDSESGDDAFDHKEFRELFSLPPTECPLQGWMKGKRTVLIGKERHIVSLLSKKRGKLYLTKSFLCFEREKTPSRRNIVIPLCDIVRLEKVKPYAKMPGRGMAIQISINHEGKENVFVFGGIIGRDEVMTSIEEALKNVALGPSLSRTDKETSRSPVPKRRSTDLSRNQNVTFAVDYVDSD